MTTGDRIKLNAARALAKEAKQSINKSHMTSGFAVAAIEALADAVEKLIDVVESKS